MEHFFTATSLRIIIFAFSHWNGISFGFCLQFVRTDECGARSFFFYLHKKKKVQHMHFIL